MKENYNVHNPLPLHINHDSEITCILDHIVMINSQCSIILFVLKACELCNLLQTNHRDPSEFGYSKEEKNLLMFAGNEDRKTKDQ